jgi:predicted transposase YdaD
MAVGIDFTRMERVNAKFHGRRGKRRDGDVIWRLPTHDGSDIYLYILLEFQSTIDRWMAVRMLVYVGLLWQQIIKEQKRSRHDR